MQRFIFVCYDHGTGGESLSLKISQLPQCHTLGHVRLGKRTVVDDVFGKQLLFRKPVVKRLENNSDLYHVVPSHLPPEQLKSLYPDAIYVVINFPTDVVWQRRLTIRKWRYFACSVCDSYKQRLGEYQDRGGDLNNTQHLKLLSKPMRNIEIRCLAKNLPITKENCRRVFADSLGNGLMNHNEQHCQICIPFSDVYHNQLVELFEKIHNTIEEIQ